MGFALMRIYLDTAPIIYTVEHVLPYSDTLDQMLTSPNVQIYTSLLSRLECRVKPIRENNAVLLSDYEHFFTAAIEQMITLSQEVIERATDIRAVYGYPAPDAIHLAAALTARCDQFVTNDHRLEKYPDIPVVLLSGDANRHA